MIDFSLSEEEQMIRDTVRAFIQKEIIPLEPLVLRNEREHRPGISTEQAQDLQQKAKAAGFWGIGTPEEYGGVDLGPVMRSIIAMETGRSFVPFKLGGTADNILYGANEEQKQKYLIPTINGERHSCFAITEPGAGSDASSMVTTAVKDGDDYILNGRKCFISGAPLADYCIVYAKTDMSRGNKGISAFIVDMKAPGVSCGKHEAKMGLVGYATSDVVLEDVRVHKSDMLGKENMGFINAMKTLDGGRLGVSAQSIGLAQGCLDEAIKYSKERVQFGKPICKNQAIAFMLADMATKLTAAKELVYMAAQMMDRNDPNASMYCSMAKYFASETCNEIAAKAVQIHGGYGYIKEYPVERKYRDCRVFTIYEGTSQVQQMVISGNLLK